MGAPSSGPGHSPASMAALEHEESAGHPACSSTREVVTFDLEWRLLLLEGKRIMLFDLATSEASRHQPRTPPTTKHCWQDADAQIGNSGRIESAASFKSCIPIACPILTSYIYISRQSVCSTTHSKTQNQLLLSPPLASRSSFILATRFLNSSYWHFS